MGFFTGLFGSDSTRLLRGLEEMVKHIASLEPRMQKLADADFKEETKKLRSRVQNGESVDNLVAEAFALVREAARRTLGQRHYDVQILGGLVLHRGNIAEMKTGEGKTLVATLAAYLNALSGEGVHVITVNDYLARRDAVWMGQVYALLGLSVGVVNGQNQSFLYDREHIEKDAERDAVGAFKVVHEFLRPVSKREAYEADITYGTNSEFGFDYLRDNTAYRRDQLVQRGFPYAIVDEIDSILIDEARTPLIISMPSAESEGIYAQFADIARTLQPDADYTVDEKMHAIFLTDSGIQKAEQALGIENMYTDAGVKYVHHLETAIKARALYLRDREYVVRDGEVVIVDEFTGRLQPGRRWSEGLHQAVEAKEGVRVQRESRTAASVTYQNFFRMYKKLSGMTGTALTSAEEFYKVYGLETVDIPTNRPVVRADHDDLIFKNESGKFAAVSKKVRELHERGQPVLVGTVAVENNERLSAYLTSAGIPHEILNAKNHEREGEIIAEAGKRGAVTIATNMAGRGVDIKLGGAQASEDERGAIKALGGLYVIGTERHDARRIDNQLRGRSGRQGDPGETQFFVSLDDKLMRIFATDTVRGLMNRLNMPEDEPIQNRIITRSLETAQKKIEGFNFDARRHVLEFDDTLNTQRRSTYAKRRAMLVGTNEEVLTVLGAYVAGSAEAESAIVARRGELGDDAFVEIIRRLILQTLDIHWINHLESMEYLRSSVNLRAYGHRDPLVEYKREGKILFDTMEASVATRITELVPNIRAQALEREEEKLAKTREAMRAIGGGEAGDVQTPVVRSAKIGRNDLVTITNGTETQEMKWKKAERFIEEDGWRLVEK